MDRIIVFDTNVLLTDADALTSYPNAELIVPETVLSEIDKLKTARVDPDLRFKGRKLSRMLFELADGQSLIEGVQLDNGSSLRVAPFEYNSGGLPDGFTTRASDDKILATAYLIQQEAPKDRPVYLITNDLNMLLKAQTIGVRVEQYGSGSDVTFGKRFIIRPLQRYRVSITILAVAIAVFAGTVWVATTMSGGRSNAGVPVLTTEYRNLLTTDQRNAWDSLLALEANPADTSALRILGNFYFGKTESARQIGDNVGVVESAKTGARYYERYLSYVPTDADVRVDMASLFLYSGDADRAIQEVTNVLASNPNHVNANFNLGMYYYQSGKDLKRAATQMEKVLELTNTEDQHSIHEQAKFYLDQINAALESTPVEPASNE